MPSRNATQRGKIPFPQIPLTLLPQTDHLVPFCCASTGENDVFRIVGESFPYARYMSYQTYDIPGFMSQVRTS